MRTAVVIGAGGAGREIAAWYSAGTKNSEVVGFLDGAVGTHGQSRGDLRVLGGLDWLADNEVDDVVLGVGAPAARRDATATLAELCITPATVVHPTATIGERVTIGDGAVVSPGVILTVDIEVGPCTYLNYGVAIGHDTTVGAYAVVAPGATIAGTVSIEAGVDFGVGASSIQGITIGEGAIIGGGACVTRDIPARHVAVGVPAEPIKEHDCW